MIQAAQPEQIPNQNKDKPKEQVISKVPGFGTPIEPHLTNSNKNNQSEWTGKFFHWWHKIAIVTLTIYGLFDLSGSLKFVLVEYPKLNNLLKLHKIESFEVNHLISKGIITAIVATITLFLAIRLSKVKETTAHNIDLFVATFLIISSRLIQNFLIQLDLLNLVLSLIN